MNAALLDRRMLWACTLLFMLRVVGQVEVVLLSPPWLPPMEAWYSGLLPYPVLLPVQIAILMAMAVLSAHDIDTSPRERRWPTLVRGVAIVYFIAMVVRLLVQVLRGAPDLLAAGAIPVAFHWILALFLLVLARAHRPRARL